MKKLLSLLTLIPFVSNAGTAFIFFNASGVPVKLAGMVVGSSYPSSVKHNLQISAYNGKTLETEKGVFTISCDESKLSLCDTQGKKVTLNNRQGGEMDSFNYAHIEGWILQVNPGGLIHARGEAYAHAAAQ